MIFQIGGSLAALKSEREVAATTPDDAVPAPTRMGRWEGRAPPVNKQKTVSLEVFIGNSGIFGTNLILIKNSPINSSINSLIRRQNSMTSGKIETQCALVLPNSTGATI